MELLDRRRDSVSVPLEYETAVGPRELAGRVHVLDRGRPDTGHRHLLRRSERDSARTCDTIADQDIALLHRDDYVAITARHREARARRANHRAPGIDDEWT